jgi:hypothetical protein
MAEYWHVEVKFENVTARIFKALCNQLIEALQLNNEEHEEGCGSESGEITIDRWGSRDFPEAVRNCNIWKVCDMNGIYYEVAFFLTVTEMVKVFDEDFESPSVEIERKPNDLINETMILNDIYEEKHRAGCYNLLEELENITDNPGADGQFPQPKNL